MIHEVHGDILLTKAQALAHGIAPNDPFDRGLALALREKWPMMHKDYRHYAHQAHPKPGEIWEWGGFGARIINLLTQEGTFEHGTHPGHATLSNVNHCLKRLRHAIEKQELKSIALPRLATGVGGLKWEDVKPLVQQHLGTLDIPVIVYTEYHAGQQAKEPL
ncbi:MAG: macro domain-containing protein [Planctomycetaceae bacterium]|jgi:O-acetyl-ADP-ribose deacetylase (regulator of RNase III)